MATEVAEEVKEQMLEEVNWATMTKSAPFLGYFSLLMLIGFVGNLVVFAVYYNGFNASVTRTCVLTMSVVDLLTNLVALPVEILRIRYHATFYAGWECKLHWFVLSTLIIFSGLILVFLAVDRKRHICRRHNSQKQRKVNIALAGCFGISALLAAPRLVIMGQQTFRPEGHPVSGVTCGLQDLYGYERSVCVRIYDGLLALWFLVIISIMFVSYGQIACFLRQYQRRERCSAPKRVLEHLQRRQHHSETCLSTIQQTVSVDERLIVEGSQEQKDSINNTISATNCPPMSGWQDNTETVDNTHANVSKTQFSEADNLNKSCDSSTMTILGSQDDFRETGVLKVVTQKPTDKGKLTSTSIRSISSVVRRSKKIPKRTTLMLFVLSMALVINFLPFLVLEFMQKFRPRLNAAMEMNVYLVLSNTQYINSVVNPLIYSLCSARFRLECRKQFNSGLATFLCRSRL